MAELRDRKLQLEIEAVRLLMESMRDILAEDEELREDTIEGETDFKEVLNQYVALILEYEGLEKGLAETIKHLQDRRARLRSTAENMREIVKVALERAEIDKLRVPAASLSVRMGQPPLLLDDDWALMLPPEYIRRAEPEPDKMAIRRALKDGAEIPGAKLGNGSPVLSMRTK